MSATAIDLSAATTAATSLADGLKAEVPNLAVPVFTVFGIFVLIGATMRLVRRGAK